MRPVVVVERVVFELLSFPVPLRDGPVVCNELRLPPFGPVVDVTTVLLLVEGPVLRVLWVDDAGFSRHRVVFESWTWVLGFPAFQSSSLVLLDRDRVLLRALDQETLTLHRDVGGLPGPQRSARANRSQRRILSSHVPSVVCDVQL